ncbi:19689_t:CDS:2 [Gigaspora rosea]|nr:19689_t:CDS:2 [Gigaspora rosea]
MFPILLLHCCFSLSLALFVSITQKALKKQDRTVIKKLQNIHKELATTNEKDENDENDEKDKENKEYEEDDNDEVPFDLQNP